ncbi:MAG: hypothetical protein WDZ84_01180 [Rhodovibrionaceae bacterium]
MSQEHLKITELDLLAYADGFLDSDPGRKAEVERHLEENPEAAAYVEEILAQNAEIREAYGALLSKPVPEKFNSLLFAERSGIQHNRLARAAAVFVLLAASAAGGWLLGHENSAQQAALEDFVKQAASSHQIAASESGIPDGTEVQGPTQPLGWLTERISLELQAPNLTASGYDLVAKKRLGPDRDPTVQLIYSSRNGTKMNLFLRPRWEDTEGALRSATVGERAVMYWLEGPLALAMTVDAPETAARTLAQSVREAFNRARLNERAPATALSPAVPSSTTGQALDDELQGPSRPATPSREQGEPASQIN